MASAAQQAGTAAVNRIPFGVSHIVLQRRCSMT